MKAWKQRDRFFRGETDQGVESNANFMSAFKMTGQAKIPAVCEFVSTLLDNNCKFLLFAYHLSVLDAIEQLMVRRQRNEKQCMGYIRIDGSIDPTQRHHLVN